MNCPNGHVSTSSDYCSVCGVNMIGDTGAAPSGDSASSESAVCPKCQTSQLDPNGQFCENCGHKLDELVSETPKTPTPVGVVAISAQTPRGAIAGSTAPAPPDLAPAKPNAVNWRIECRVFKGNPAPEEPTAATYETAFELELKGPVTQIGRSSQKRNLHPEIACDWDDAVSHRHAKIELDPEGNAFLSDIGSTNGTMVNGQIIAANTPTKLADGDRISLGGKTAFIVHGGKESGARIQEPGGQG